MPIEFRPATIDGTGCFISITGGSRSGKTVTALRLATGFAGKKGKIAAIDTEGRRMSHHAKKFKFDVHNMQAPYSPHLFAEAAESAQASGYSALITDSFSLEWNGEGGVTSIYEREFAKVGRNPKKSDVCWAIAKAPHKDMRNRLMALTMPIIFCSRCNEVPKHLGGGWKPEQDQRWLYEWTIALALHPDAPGMPAFNMVDAKGSPLEKIPPDLMPLFPAGRYIGEAAGEALQLWRNGQPFSLRDEEQPKEDKQADGTNKLVRRIREATTLDQIAEIFASQPLREWLGRLATSRPELHQDVTAAQRDAVARLTPVETCGDDPAEPGETDSKESENV